MPSDLPLRSSIVEALDDLEEREKIAGAWTTDSEDAPYTPRAVRERSRRLREGLGGRRFGVYFVSLLIAVTGGIGIADWPIPRALSGFLFGLGTTFLVVSPFTTPWAERQVRALQLYELLEQIDAGSEPVTPTSADE